jgi:circadian clock protein KaiB
MNDSHKNKENSPEFLENSNSSIDPLANLEVETYVFRLYIAHNNFKSIQAVKNIKSICEEHLKGRYELEIIDIYENPERLEQEQIFAVPTLIKELPPPLQRLIGDMADKEKVKICLSI